MYTVHIDIGGEKNTLDIQCQVHDSALTKYTTTCVCAVRLYTIVIIIIYTCIYNYYSIIVNQLRYCSDN